MPVTRKKTIRRFVIALSLCLSAAAGAGPSLLEYKVKAAYLYNFLLFVEWPPTAFEADPPAPIDLCVLGDDSFPRILSPITQRTAQRRNIRLKRLEPGDAVEQCHLLFIGESEADGLGSLFTRLNGTHVLTVADIPDFASRGGMIGFVVKGGKVRLEINLNTARTAGLKVSSKLLEVASRIFGR